jgi:hypothetical protein
VARFGRAKREPLAGSDRRGFSVVEYNAKGKSSLACVNAKVVVLPCKFCISVGMRGS